MISFIDGKPVLSLRKTALLHRSTLHPRIRSATVLLSALVEDVDLAISSHGGTPPGDLGLAYTKPSAWDALLEDRVVLGLIHGILLPISLDFRSYCPSDTADALSDLVELADLPWTRLTPGFSSTWPGIRIGSSGSSVRMRRSTGSLQRIR